MKDRVGLFFLLALAVFSLDVITKYIVKATLGPLDVIRVLPFFNVVCVENTGSAFGMFKSLGNLFFVIVSLLAVVVVSCLIVRDRTNRLSLALVLGGAAGNLLDRLIRGYVVDFFDLHAGGVHWPAFNVADSALTVGIVLLFFNTLFPHRLAGR